MTRNRGPQGEAGAVEKREPNSSLGMEEKAEKLLQTGFQRAMTVPEIALWSISWPLAREISGHLKRILEASSSTTPLFGGSATGSWHVRNQVAVVVSSTSTFHSSRYTIHMTKIMTKAPEKNPSEIIDLLRIDTRDLGPILSQGAPDCGRARR